MKLIASFKKSVALGLVVTFVMTQNTPVSFAQVAQALFNTSDRPLLPQQIPAEFGRIQETHPSTNGKSVILIQDAHASLPVQKNIRSLISFLNQEYGINLLMLEGASQKLEPDLYRFYEEAEPSRLVGERLLERGELTGAEMFLLDQAIDKNCGWAKPGEKQKPECAEGQGAESAGAYALDLTLFREIISRDKELAEEMNGLSLLFQKKAGSILKPELLQFLKAVDQSETAEQALPETLQKINVQAQATLQMDLLNPRYQFEYPMLVRYFKLKEMEGKIQPELAETESQRLVKWLEVNQAPQVLVKQIRELSPKTSQVRAVLEELVREMQSKGFDFKNYPDWTRWAGMNALMQEVEPSALMKEMEELTWKIVSKLAPKPEERALLTAYRKVFYLRKLLTLSLSSEEWAKVDARRSEIVPSRLSSELDGAKIESNLDKAFSKAVEFYEMAKQRETYFVENLQKQMQSKNQERAVLVLGGFHQSGVLEKLKTSGYGYVSVMPNAGGFDLKESKKTYRRAMLETAQVQQVLRTQPNFIGGNLEYRHSQILEAMTGVKGRKRSGTALSLQRSVVGGRPSALVRSEARASAVIQAEIDKLMVEIKQIETDAAHISIVSEDLGKEKMAEADDLRAQIVDFEREIAQALKDEAEKKTVDPKTKLDELRKQLAAKEKKLQEAIKKKGPQVSALQVENDLLGKLIVAYEKLVNVEAEIASAASPEAAPVGVGVGISGVAQQFKIKEKTFDPKTAGAMESILLQGKKSKPGSTYIRRNAKNFVDFLELILISGINQPGAGDEAKFPGLDWPDLVSVQQQEDSSDIYLIVKDDVDFSDNRKFPKKSKQKQYNFIWLHQKDVESAEGYAKYKDVLEYESIASAGTGTLVHVPIAASQNIKTKPVSLGQGREVFAEYDPTQNKVEIFIKEGGSPPALSEEIDMSSGEKVIGLELIPADAVRNTSPILVVIRKNYISMPYIDGEGKTGAGPFKKLNKKVQSYELTYNAQKKNYNLILNFSGGSQEGWLLAWGDDAIQGPLWTKPVASASKAEESKIVSKKWGRNRLHPKAPDSGLVFEVDLVLDQPVIRTKPGEQTIDFPIQGLTSDQIKQIAIASGNQSGFMYILVEDAVDETQLPNQMMITDQDNVRKNYLIFYVKDKDLELNPKLYEGYFEYEQTPTAVAISAPTTKQIKRWDGTEQFIDRLSKRPRVKVYSSSEQGRKNVVLFSESKNHKMYLMVIVNGREKELKVNNLIQAAYHKGKYYLVVTDAVNVAKTNQKMGGTDFVYLTEDEALNDPRYKGLFETEPVSDRPITSEVAPVHLGGGDGLAALEERRDELLKLIAELEAQLADHPSTKLRTGDREVVFAHQFKVKQWLGNTRVFDHETPASVASDSVILATHNHFTLSHYRPANPSDNGLYVVIDEVEHVKGRAKKPKELVMETFPVQLEKIVNIGVSPERIVIVASDVAEVKKAFDKKILNYDVDVIGVEEALKNRIELEKMGVEFEPIVQPKLAALEIYDRLPDDKWTEKNLTDAPFYSEKTWVYGNISQATFKIGRDGAWQIVFNLGKTTITAEWRADKKEFSMKHEYGTDSPVQFTIPVDSDPLRDALFDFDGTEFTNGEVVLYFDKSFMGQIDQTPNARPFIAAVTGFNNRYRGGIQFLVKPHQKSTAPTSYELNSVEDFKKLFDAVPWTAGNSGDAHFKRPDYPANVDARNQDYPILQHENQNWVITVNYLGLTVRVHDGKQRVYLGATELTAGGEKKLPVQVSIDIDSKIFRFTIDKAYEKEILALITRGYPGVDNNQGTLTSNPSNDAIEPRWGWEIKFADPAAYVSPNASSVSAAIKDPVLDSVLDGFSQLPWPDQVSTHSAVGVMQHYKKLQTGSEELSIRFGEYGEQSSNLNGEWTISLGQKSKKRKLYAFSDVAAGGLIVQDLKIVVGRLQPRGSLNIKPQLSWDETENQIILRWPKILEDELTKKLKGKINSPANGGIGWRFEFDEALNPPDSEAWSVIVDRANRSEARASSVVQAEITDKEREIAALSDEKGVHDRHVAEWTELFGGLDDETNPAVEAKQEADRIQGEIDQIKKTVADLEQELAEALAEEAARGGYDAKGELAKVNTQIVELETKLASSTSELAPVRLGGGVALNWSSIIQQVLQINEGEKVKVDSSGSRIYSLVEPDAQKAIREGIESRGKSPDDILKDDPHISQVINQTSSGKYKFFAISDGKNGYVFYVMQSGDRVIGLFPDELAQLVEFEQPPPGSKFSSMIAPYTVYENRIKALFDAAAATPEVNSSHLGGGVGSATTQKQLKEWDGKTLQPINDEWSFSADGATWGIKLNAKSRVTGRDIADYPSLPVKVQDILQIQMFENDMNITGVHDRFEFVVLIDEYADVSQLPESVTAPFVRTAEYGYGEVKFHWVRPSQLSSTPSGGYEVRITPKAGGPDKIVQFESETISAPAATTPAKDDARALKKWDGKPYGIEGTLAGMSVSSEGAVVVGDGMGGPFITLPIQAEKIYQAKFDEEAAEYVFLVTEDIDVISLPTEIESSNNTIFWNIRWVKPSMLSKDSVENFYIHSSDAGAPHVKFESEAFGAGVRVLKKWDGNNLDLPSGYTLSKQGAGNKLGLWSMQGTFYPLNIPSESVYQVLQNGIDAEGDDKFIVLVEDGVKDSFAEEEVVSSTSSFISVNVLWISKKDLVQTAEGDWEAHIPSKEKFAQSMGVKPTVVKFESEIVSALATKKQLAKWDKKEKKLGQIPGQSNLELSLVRENDLGTKWFAALKLNDTQSTSFIPPVNFAIKGDQAFLLDEVVQAEYVEEDATVYVVLEDSVPQERFKEALPEIAFAEKNITLNVKYVYQSEVEANPDQYPMFEFEAIRPLARWNGKRQVIGKVLENGTEVELLDKSTLGSGAVVIKGTGGTTKIQIGAGSDLKAEQLIQAKYNHADKKIYLVVTEDVDLDLAKQSSIQNVVWLHEGDINDSNKHIFEFEEPISEATASLPSASVGGLQPVLGSSELKSQLAELYKRREKLTELIAIEGRLGAAPQLSLPAVLQDTSVAQQEWRVLPIERDESKFTGKMGKVYIDNYQVQFDSEVSGYSLSFDKSEDGLVIEGSAAGEYPRVYSVGRWDISVDSAKFLSAGYDKKRNRLYIVLDDSIGQIPAGLIQNIPGADIHYLLQSEAVQKQDELSEFLAFEKLVAPSVIPAQAGIQPSSVSSLQPVLSQAEGSSVSSDQLESLKNRRARLIDWLNFTNAALIAGIEGIAAQIVMLVEEWLEIDQQINRTEYKVQSTKYKEKLNS